MKILLAITFVLAAFATQADVLAIGDVVETAIVTNTAVSEPSFDLVALLVGVFGEKSVYAITFIAVGGFIWAQLRQLISTELLEKLPSWLVWFLELLAANQGNAKNAMNSSPAKKE